MCVICDGELTGRQTRYCSQRCSSKALYQQQASQGYRQQLHVKAKRNDWANANRARFAGSEAEVEYARRRCRRDRALTKLRKAARGTKRRNGWTAGSCAVCHVTFVTSVAWTRTCSPACARAWKRLTGKDGSGLSYELRHLVFSRDRWLCGICGDPTDRNASVPDLAAPTIDHVQPRARGGSDEIDNLQCAHFYCNSVKRDTVGFEFVTL